MFAHQQIGRALLSHWNRLERMRWLAVVRKWVFRKVLLCVAWTGFEKQVRISNSPQGEFQIDNNVSVSVK